MGDSKPSVNPIIPSHDEARELRINRGRVHISGFAIGGKIMISYKSL